MIITNVDLTTQQDRRLNSGKFFFTLNIWLEFICSIYEFRSLKKTLIINKTSIQLDMPLAASNPHFYGRYPNELTKKLEGFEPIKDKHQSFIIVEPVMGVPIDQSARSQSNVILPEFYFLFSDEIKRFSNMALPTFWVEYVNIFTFF